MISETNWIDFVVKGLINAPFQLLAAVGIWFLIKQYWPWYKEKEEARIKADIEYRDSWLRHSEASTAAVNTFREHTNARLGAIETALVDIRYDMDAVLMVLARDKPELIEFFKHREDSRRNYKELHTHDTARSL